VFVAIALLVCFGLILNTRSRLSRIEQRLGALEDARIQVLREAMPPIPVIEPDVRREAMPEPASYTPALQPEAIPIAEPAPVRRRAALKVPVVEAVESDVEQPAKPESEPAPVAAPRSLSINFEDLFGRRLPIWAGGITLAIAGVFIVKLAIEAGFFTPWIQVICGLLFGAGLIAGAEAALRAEETVRDDRVRQALSGAGIATLYATILMASNVYGLIGSAAAFTGLAFVTAAALALSIRFGAPSALLGLAGGLAAPALVGSVDPDVPLLSVYLALTIGGLTAVSRTKRWAWLGVSALIGGAGWSLMLIATGALDVVSSLSIGALVLLLALALPFIAFTGPRATLLRNLTALVGAGQLALLVAIGGFTPLNWGMFALVALAAQWLSWRTRDFDIVPSISLGLAVLLLAIWPDPDADWFAPIGAAMALIHAVPLLLKLWRDPPRFQLGLELAAVSLAIPAIAAFHFYRFDGSLDTLFALLALAGAAVSAIGAGLGWSRPERLADARFALLTANTGFLVACAIALVVPWWTLPFGIAAVAAAILLIGERAGDRRLETVSTAFALATLAVLLGSDPAPMGEAARLLGIDATGFDLQGLARWLGAIAPFALLAFRAHLGPVRVIGQGFAALLAYGALAQILPAFLLPATAAAGLAGLAMLVRKSDRSRFAPATGVLALIVIGWVLGPIRAWSVPATLSLAGVPMTVEGPLLSTSVILERLFVPAMLAGFALWHGRAQLSRTSQWIGAAAVAIPAVVGLHSLYRIGFAAVTGTDFVTTGLAERCILAGLLLGGGWVLSRRAEARLAAIGLIAAGTLHAFWYTLVLHNPLWAAQAVGTIPLANWLLPVFALVPAGLWLLTSLAPAPMTRIEPVARILRMIIVILFAYATLRQAFAGTLLVALGLTSLEDILRSILAIVLAIGFLLWGIRSGGRDWRIASLVLMLAAVAKVFLRDASGLEGLLRIGSFVALGFSLIGIGWLYSRQLAATPQKDAAG
jgi:uncharacterized membrane protein